MKKLIPSALSTINFFEKINKLAFVLFILLISGCSKDKTTIKTPKNKLEQPESVTQQKHLNISRQFSQGEVHYIQHCSDCHGWQGRGNGQAAHYLGIAIPSLDSKMITSLSDNILIDKLLYGDPIKFNARDSKFLNQQAEINNLLNFLKKIPDTDWKTVTQGQQIYDSLCVSCHGLYGRGDGHLSTTFPTPIPDLSKAISQSKSDNAIYQIIAKGKNAMPGSENVLTKDKINKVVHYVKTLSPGYESYDRVCSNCHGKTGHPQENFLDQENIEAEFAELNIPVFNAAYFNSQSDQQLRKKIQHMLLSDQLSMPHFDGILNTEQIKQILDYLKNL